MNYLQGFGQKKRRAKVSGIWNDRKLSLPKNLHVNQPILNKTEINEFSSQLSINQQFITSRSNKFKYNNFGNGVHKKSSSIDSETNKNSNFKVNALPDKCGGYSVIQDNKMKTQKPNIPSDLKGFQTLYQNYIPTKEDNTIRINENYKVFQHMNKTKHSSIKFGSIPSERISQYKLTESDRMIKKKPHAPNYDLSKKIKYSHFDKLVDLIYDEDNIKTENMKPTENDNLINMNKSNMVSGIIIGNSGYANKTHRENISNHSDHNSMEKSDLINNSLKGNDKIKISVTHNEQSQSTTDYNIIKAKDPKTKHKSHLSVNLNLKEILHKSEYRKMSNNFTLKRSLCPNSNKTLITAQNAIKDSPIKESKTEDRKSVV